MDTVNKVQVLGFLGGDPAVRFTKESTPVCNFSVATNSVYKNKAGEKTEKTEWHRIVTFGKLAEACGEYLKKGSKVYIEGQNRTREYDDKDGVKRFITEVVVPVFGKVIFLDSKGNGKESSAKKGDDYVPPFPQGDESDDCPF